MVHLWIGVAAGALLTHLWTDIPFWEVRTGGFYVPTPPRPDRRRVSMRWSAVALIFAGLIFIVLRDFSRSGLPGFDAAKSILLPTLVGMGFGVWIYAALAPVVRGEASASWSPMLIALLFVAAILSEERYGWFGRLQKITIAGGGVEFAALAPTGATPTDRSLLGSVIGATGADRIDYALGVVKNLPKAIDRDLAYARETGRADLGIEYHYAADIEFVTKALAPLAARLQEIHEVRGYNDIEHITNRRFIDDFRAFVHGHMKARKWDEDPDPARMLIDRIKDIWYATCGVEQQLRDAKYIATPPDESVKPPADTSKKSRSDQSKKSPAEDAKKSQGCEQDREKAVEFLDKAPGRLIAFNRELPYGAVISSMLLYAAGETDSAVRDLERWIAFHGTGDKRTFREIGLYRARYLAVQLLARENPEADKVHVVIEKYHELIEQADSLLTSTVESQFRSWLPADVWSWRGQRERLAKSASGWATADCEEDLSPDFKSFMHAYLSAKNNLAYYLGQNLELAAIERRDRLMRKFADEVATANMSCLRRDRSSDADHDARSSRASFLDTAASVQLELALREERRAERRELLCKAQDYVQEAIAVYDPVLRARQGESKSALNTPSPQAERASRHAKKRRMEATQMKVILQRRLQRVQGTLAHGGLSC